MHGPRMLDLGRREFLTRTSALGAAGLAALYHRSAVAEPPPETTKIRFVHGPFICVAPQYLAEEFLPLEGFTDWSYVPLGTRTGPRRACGGAGRHRACGIRPNSCPIWTLASRSWSSPACMAVATNSSAGERVRAVRDLKGKTAAIHYFGSGDHVLLSTMLSYVGIDPRQEVNWITGRDLRNAMDLFAEGKADAFVGYAQEPAELRLKKVGQVIRRHRRTIAPGPSTSAAWSSRTGTLRRATRSRPNVHCARSSRPADICATDPERVARFLVAKQYETRYPSRTGSDEEFAVLPLARSQPGGHAALLRSASARGGDDQIDAGEAHRAGHRLAVFERVETGAEGVR